MHVRLLILLWIVRRVLGREIARGWATAIAYHGRWRIGGGVRRADLRARSRMPIAASTIR